jgi:hypothetical protein
MLLNTMIDKDLNLSCLVNGDYISKEFTLPMSSTETVGQLRKAIHLSKPIWFKDLEAEDLTLWRVFIPDNIQDSAITRDALDDKTELNRPKTLLSLVFPKPPDDNTYILVDRPPPGNAHTRLLLFVTCCWNELRYSILMLSSLCRPRVGV